MLKKSKAKKNSLFGYVSWSIVDLLTCISPLGAVIIKNKETYFTYRNSMSISIGLMLSTVFLFLIISKKTSVLKGWGGFLFFFLICYCLKTILNDLVLLSGAATIGMFFSQTFTSKIAKRYKRIYDKTETAIIFTNTKENTYINGRG